MTNTPPVTPPASRVVEAPSRIPPSPQGSTPRSATFENRFRVIDRLASGGSAIVYLCEDLTLRSRAAVKVLNTADPEMRQRFSEEATLLANVRHPHLVQVLSAGECKDGSPYIAMEDLGENLDRRLREGGPLPWREVVQVALQVADALQALHRAGIVHRDVKPSNIAQVQGEEGQLFVKLIDLGIACAEDLASLQQGGPELPAREGALEDPALGTPGFMPPEAGLSPPTPGFDVYALGVSIVLLCTGELHDPTEPRRMGELRPELEIPAELEAVVMRALAVNPEDRISSAAAFSRQLAAVQRAEGSGSPPHPEVLFDGRFELIELLGVGAKAEVYRAYDCGARRYVALKILRDEALDNDEERARFNREARVLGVLKHPVIPALIECYVGQEEEQEEEEGPGQDRPLYIAMDLRKGQPISALGVELLSPEEVLEVGLQLASALAEMHRRGIIHRDLNRSNVLIERRDPSREDPRILCLSLVDFGQVELDERFYAGTTERYLTPPKDRKSLGSGGLEKLDWSAPETRQGGPWTSKSDVYSLGLILYRLLTGKRPPKDPKEPWSPRVEHVPEDWGALVEAILGALRVDHKSRFDALTLGSRLREAGDEFRKIKLEEARMAERARILDANDQQSASNPKNIDVADSSRSVPDAADDAGREDERLDRVDRGEKPEGAALSSQVSASGSRARALAASDSAQARPERRRRGSPWIVGGALLSLSIGMVWLLSGTPRNSVVTSAAIARTVQRAMEEVETPECVPTPRESELRGSQDPQADAVDETSEGSRARTEQENTEDRRAALEPKDRPDPQPRAGAVQKEKGVQDPPGANESRRPAAASKAALRRVRDASLSGASGDLEHCLEAGDTVGLVVSVAANGAIKKVSLDAPDLLSLAEKCLRLRLSRIRFQSGHFSTVHRRRLGAKSP